MATCCTAFMAGNLFAGESDTSAQKIKSPHDSLASLLKSTHKKSSTDTTVSSHKKSSKHKYTHHRAKAKKFARCKKTHKKMAYAGKHHKKYKHSYGKTKHYKKSYKHKTRTARY